MHMRLRGGRNTMKLISVIIGLLLISNVFVIFNAAERTGIHERRETLAFSEPNIQHGDHYLTVDVGEATSRLMEPGKPVLPLCSKTFVFPFGTKITGIDCTLLQTSQLSIAGEIQPSSAPVLLTDPNTGDASKDAAVYQSDALYPSAWYDYRVGCGLDGSQHAVFVTVHVYPVRYSPGQQMIQYAQRVDIRVDYTEPSQPITAPTVFNMVVIAPAEFTEKLQPLIAYENDSGVATKLVTLDAIYAGTYFPVNGRDDQEKIKYFIKDAIEEWNTSNVLLTGGTNKVPVRMTYVQDGREVNFTSDLYYADIYDSSGQFCSWDSNNNNIFGENGYNGNTDIVDLYPDACLSRLNFRDVSEISDVVNKIITYESTGAYLQPWFHQFVVCGGDTFQDYSYVNEGEYLNQLAIDMMTGFTPDEIWSSNGRLQFATIIDHAIENGTGFFYMTGHGTYESWATHPHDDFNTWWPLGGYFYFRVAGLNNGEKLPVVLIGGCSNCQFTHDNCYGWSFVKNPNGGGIASYGNTGLGWSMSGTGCAQVLTGAMELSAIKAYSVQHAKTTGELWIKAINNYLHNFSAWSGLDDKTVEEWQSFGDPALTISWVSDKPDTPQKMSGVTAGEINQAYTYTTTTTDPNINMIKYCVDWGNSTITWTDWYESGKTVTLNHAWEKPGTYDVRVKARDTYGLDSAWSDPLTVTIIANGSFLDFAKIKGGVMNIKAVLTNIGSVDATNVIWDVAVTGGIFKIINVHANGTIATLAVQQKTTVTAGTIFGFGKLNITITATAPYANIATKTVQGFAIGPIIIVR